MTVNDYIDAKYGKNGVRALLACEAKVFGISYPLSTGWAIKHGKKEITPAMQDLLMAALKRSDKNSAAAGISALNALRRLGIDWSVAPAGAAFWAVDASGQANWFMQPAAADGAFSCEGVLPAPDFGFDGDWRLSLVGKNGL